MIIRAGYYYHLWTRVGNSLHAYCHIYCLSPIQHGSRQEDHIWPKQWRVDLSRAVHYQVLCILDVEEVIGSKQAIALLCIQPLVRTDVVFNGDGPGITSRILSTRWTQWLRELSIHLMVFVVGLVGLICHELAFSELWYQLSGPPTDVRHKPRVQGSNGIVLSQSIEVHKSERGSGAELLLLRQQPVQARYPIQS